MVLTEKMYKASRYNWLVYYANACYLYNGVSSAISRVSSKYVSFVEQNIDPRNGVRLSYTDIPEEIFTHLIDCGYIIDNEFSEIEYLSAVCDTFRYNSMIRQITAVVTTRCNFGCDYCFQDNDLQMPVYMPSEVIDRITDVIRQSNTKRMGLCLFGGEPLLYPEVCVEICRKAHEAWGNRKRAINIPIITNGYYLTETNAKMLANLGVTVAQVTIDGLEKTHNKRRPLKDGGETFSVISENVRSASKYLDVIVRVNLEQGYDFNVRGLMEHFADCKRVRIKIAATKHEHCYRPDKTKNNIEMMNEVQSSLQILNSRSTLPKLTGCSAVSLGMLTVMPDGQLIRCWNEIDSEYSSREFPSIFDDNVQPLTHLYKWLSMGPFNKASQCYKCRLLPNCGGSCPDETLRFGKPHCHITEATFKELIRAEIEREESARQVT